jgi:mono/diheme cytochrome c family protein
MCHDAGGNMMDPAKPIKGIGFLSRYPSDELIAKRIREGSPNGVMPAFHKDQISDKELVDVIAYIRSLTPMMKCPATGKMIPKPQAAKAATAAGKPATPTAKKGKS